MPPRDYQLDNFRNHPPLQNTDGIKLNPIGTDTFDGVFGLDAHNSALDSALEAIAIDTAINQLVELMSPDKKERFQEFMDSYVGDPDPENRKGVQEGLPNTKFMTDWGEDFNYNLQCVAVVNPETGKILVVSKANEKDSNRSNCWRVIQYDTLEDDPEKAISDLAIQNVITDPQGNNDMVTLDIVYRDSPRFTDYQLRFSLKKEDYSRDEKQPVTLTTCVPYGQKSTFSEYLADVGELYKKIDKLKTVELPADMGSIHHELGYLATEQAA